jgi:hypothetical protein
MQFVKRIQSSQQVVELVWLALEFSVQLLNMTHAIKATISVAL